MKERKRIVQKYGGTSVGSAERILAVADRVAKLHRDGHEVAVVASAMSGQTNRLLELAAEVSSDPQKRELDSLLSTGEQVSTALLAMALNDRGVPAVSLLAHQVGISTDASFGRARIRSIDVSRVGEAFAAGEVAVVAGFQGLDENRNITTLGRGGSDTTAVALAAALEADVCEILTDVPGVFTTDPRVCPDARKLDRVSYDEMLELASLGAKVLQIRSVECAKRYGVPVHVRSSLDESEGTWVVQEDATMEEVLVSGVAFDRDQAKITLVGVPDAPGLAARIFVPLSAAGIVIDMIVQNVSDDGRTDMTFTVAKVSVVGLGMRNHAGVAARMFDLLAGEGINIQLISTSEIKISVVIDAAELERAVAVLHRGFIDEGAEPVEAGGAA